jgi:hypothetical protein
VRRPPKKWSAIAESFEKHCSTYNQHSLLTILFLFNVYLSVTITPVSKVLSIPSIEICHSKLRGIRGPQTCEINRSPKNSRNNASRLTVLVMA